MLYYYDLSYDAIMMGESNFIVVGHPYDKFFFAIFVAGLTGRSSRSQLSSR